MACNLNITGIHKRKKNNVYTKEETNTFLTS